MHSLLRNTWHRDCLDCRRTISRSRRGADLRVRIINVECGGHAAALRTVHRVARLTGDELRQGGAELIDRWRPNSGMRMWVDIEDPRHEELEPLLETRFGFHELAAEDALSANTLPKYDAFPDYDFFI